MSGVISKPSTMNTTSSSSSSSSPPSPSIDDNPCWGGPEPKRHDLEYLLRVLGSSSAAANEDTDANAHFNSPCIEGVNDRFIDRIYEKLIIHHDENYLAIHKPADVRMDGPHRASVHKLLLYLWPPPSLESRVADEMAALEKNRNTDGVEMKNIKNRVQFLLKLIEPLSKRNLLKDDPFRMVHQLDYATSGVLLLGKSRKATGVASQAFEERKTNKQYVAVVINDPSSASASSSTSNNNGDEPPLGKDFFDKLPTLPSSSLDSSWGDGSLEKRYRRKRQRDMDDRVNKQGTFDGFMPVSSVFEKWRATLVRAKKVEAMQQKQQNNDESKNAEQVNLQKERRKQRKNNAQSDLPALPPPSTILSSEEIDELLSIGYSWKKTKLHGDKHNKNWTTIVETMAKEYNQSLAEYHSKKELDQESAGNNGCDGGENKHVSNLPPLFRIQTEGKKECKENGNDGGCGQDTNSFYICASIGEPKDGRFSVIVDPSVSNQPPDSSPLPDLRPSLTKCTVLWRGHMNAKSGRIPVTKVLLKPWTGRRHQLRVHLAHIAGCPILGDVAYGGDLNTDEESNGRGAVCRRMCLHAKELTIPLIGGETKTFVAPDPFVTLKRDGCEVESLIIL